MVINQVNA